MKTKQQNGKLSKLELPKLEGCKCFPSKDNEIITEAIKISKNIYKEDIRKIKSAGSGRLDIVLTVQQYRQELKDILDLENRINNTPVCKDGDILRDCECFSDLERKTIENIRNLIRVESSGQGKRGIIKRIDTDILADKILSSKIC